MGQAEGLVQLEEATSRKKKKKKHHMNLYNLKPLDVFKFHPLSPFLIIEGTSMEILHRFCIQDSGLAALDEH